MDKKNLNKNEFIKQVLEFNKKQELDLSSGEDLSIGLMNLISLEEHAYFSYIKTSDEKFLELLNKVREIRKEHLKKIVNEKDGEVWCMSKHLLASSIRLIETGNKFLKDGKKKEAEKLYEDAFELYSMFWMINLKEGSIKSLNKREKSGFSQVLKKLLDCCKE